MREAGAGLLDQAVNQRLIARGADLAGQPQATANGQRQRLPHSPLAEPDPEFISLDVDLVDRAVVDQVLLNALGLLATALQPGADGVLMQPVGEDDGLHRTAMRQQGQDDDHQLSGVM